MNSAGQSISSTLIQFSEQEKETWKETFMTNTVAQMSKDELRELIEESIENKLLELLEDPDRGLELKKEVRERLRRSFAAEERGERGISAEELAKRLGIQE